jgi:DNA-binding MurR/RpiR family transcriptional regulator
MVDLTPDDVVVVFGFRRRPRILPALIQSLTAPYTVLFTDESGQVFNQDVDALLLCFLGESRAMDSYAAPMSLTSAIANEVYRKLGNLAQKRVKLISERYDDYGELG